MSPGRRPPRLHWFQIAMFMTTSLICALRDSPVSRRSTEADETSVCGAPAPALLTGRDAIGVASSLFAPPGAVRGPELAMKDSTTGFAASHSGWFG